MLHFGEVGKQYNEESVCLKKRYVGVEPGAFLLAVPHKSIGIFIKTTVGKECVVFGSLRLNNRGSV